MHTRFDISDIGVDEAKRWFRFQASKSRARNKPTPEKTAKYRVSFTQRDRMNMGPWRCSACIARLKELAEKHITEGTMARYKIEYDVPQEDGLAIELTFYNTSQKFINLMDGLIGKKEKDD